ncbi:putative DNA helicase [Actinobaculum suis]|uniref:Putative DNA helicase n=1 Tax=Actinobaculum suis TaxID=1657 RepID=A0A7Z8Y8D9_9ACTO|nr:hypothetical protein [Actinobaculum suis]VDG75807.1 putative DNA helicase [Actinobaculum suis]
MSPFFKRNRNKNNASREGVEEVQAGEFSTPSAESPAPSAASSEVANSEAASFTEPGSVPSADSTAGFSLTPGETTSAAEGTTGASFASANSAADNAAESPADLELPLHRDVTARSETQLTSRTLAPSAESLPSAGPGRAAGTPPARHAALGGGWSRRSTLRSGRRYRAAGTSSRTDSRDAEARNTGLSGESFWGGGGATATTSAEEAAEPAVQLPEPSREELLAAALDEWRQELTAAVAENESKGTNPVIDLTHPHPTGAAQIASGSPALLTSLIREPYAQNEALSTLVQLRQKIAENREKYGYAVVHFAIGEITWTELPPRKDGDQLENFYEETGELKLDPLEIRRREAAAEAGLGLASANLSGTGTSSTSSTAGTASTSGVATHAFAAGDSTVNSAASSSAYSGGPVDDNAQAEALARPNSSYLETSTAVREVQEVTHAVLLRTVRLEDEGKDCRIVPTRDISVNPKIIAALRAHGTPTREIRKLSSLGSMSEDEALNQVRQLAQIYLPGASYTPARKLGIFIDPNREILEDVNQARPYIRRSGVLAAVAGHTETRKLTTVPLAPADKEDRSPEGERGVGDQDVAELAAVEAVATGRDVVIDTPPGSNDFGAKVSVAADAAGSGRSVLYVPGSANEARAFVEEMNRLGVGNLVVDFTDLDGAPLRLRTGLRQRIPEVDDAATLELRARLKETRRALKNYVAALHETDPAWGMSVHDVLQKLTQLTHGQHAPATEVRLAADVARDVYEHWDEVLEQLVEAARAGAFEGTDGSPWATSTVRTEAEAERAYSVASRMASETVPLAMEQSQRIASETGLDRPATVAAWIEQTKMLDGVSATLDVFKPDIYARSVEDMVIATATDEWRAQHGESMKRSQRRALRKQAKDYVRPGVSVHDMHHALLEVKKQREVWRRYSSDSSWPTLPEGMPMIRATAREVEERVAELESFLPGIGKLDQMPIEELLALTRKLAAGQSVIASQPRRNELLSGLHRRGLGALVEDCAQREVPVQKIASELELALTNSIFEQLIARNTVLADLGPAELTELLTQFRTLDKQHTETLPGPIMRAAVTNMRNIARKYREDTLTLDARLGTGGVAALPEVTRDYSALVQASRPVWVMPAAVVAHILPPAPWADVVLLDGIGSTPLSRVLGVMVRGGQIAAFGDVRGAEPGSALADLAEVLPHVELPAFRTQHDGLATEFLSELGYGDVLVPMPSTRENDPHLLTVVDGRGVPAPSTGMVEATPAEVDAVVDAVVNHALSRPQESLAVVSISESHTEQVRQAIDRAVAENPALANGLRESGSEPFAVLNVVEAEGLRRDSIILTVGFGKTVHGRVLHSFGPLHRPEGVSGLVAAVCAARRDTRIISAIGPGEIDIDDLSGKGPRLLAYLLDIAGGRGANHAEPSMVGFTALESDLVSRLQAAGLSVATHYGYDSGMRIPIVVTESDEDETKPAESPAGTSAAIAPLSGASTETSAPTGNLTAPSAGAPSAVSGGGAALPASTELSGIGTSEAVVAPSMSGAHNASCSADAAVRTAVEAGVKPGHKVAVLLDVDDYVAEPSLRRRDRYTAEVLEELGWRVYQTFTASLFLDPAGETERIIELLRRPDADAEPAPSGPEPVEVPSTVESAAWAAFGTEDDHAEVERELAQAAAQTEREEARKQRGPRPEITPGLPLAAYSDDQLDAMVAWIGSDGVERSELDFMKALRAELDIKRRGAQIDAILRNVVRRSGLLSPQNSKPGSSQNSQPGR